MGKLEQDARDKRVAEQKKRETIFASYESQQFMINLIKGPLLKIVNLYAGRFPEPTKENTWNPNSHLLIEIREEFFRHCDLEKERNTFLRVGMNFFIHMYDHDPPYRMMIDWWARKLNIQNWRYDVPVTVVGHNWPWWKE